MKNHTQGFTLTELLIGLFIGAILVLMVGVISQTAVGSHDKLRKEAEVYNDIYYGFNLIKRYVRNGLVVSEDSASDTITADNLIFRVSPQDNNDLIFTDTSSGVDNVIISDVDNLSFDVLAPDDKIIIINLSGQKDKVDFNLTTTVMRRN